MNLGLFVLDGLSTFGLIALVLDIAALTSIWFSRKHALRTKIIWTIVVALLPLLGAIAWFALGRERKAPR